MIVGRKQYYNFSLLFIGEHKMLLTNSSWIMSLWNFFEIFFSKCYEFLTPMATQVISSNLSSHANN
jgi:hypothetical protein